MNHFIIYFFACLTRLINDMRSSARGLNGSVIGLRSIPAIDGGPYGCSIRSLSCIYISIDFISAGLAVLRGLGLSDILTGLKLCYSGGKSIS